jgi:hypothetical protein
MQGVLFEVITSAPACLLNVGHGINDGYCMFSPPASMQVCSRFSHSIDTTFNTLLDISFKIRRTSAEGRPSQ